MKNEFLLFVILFFLVSHAGATTFSSNLDYNLALSGVQYSYEHNLNQVGLNPSSDIISEALLKLYFQDNDLGSSGNVAVETDGSPGGTINDPTGLSLESFNGEINVSPHMLQNDGI